MRRPAHLLSLLLILGQFALGLHQIEHRLEQLGHAGDPCGICAIADHMGGAPPAPVVAPAGSWAKAPYRALAPQALAASRPAEIRARAPPVSLG